MRKKPVIHRLQDAMTPDLYFALSGRMKTMLQHLFQVPAIEDSAIEDSKQLDSGVESTI